MTMAYILALTLIFSLLSPNSWARNDYSKNDLVGNESLCSKALQNHSANIEECTVVSGAITEGMSDSANKLDDFLAMSELRRNIEMMAEAQIQSSLQLLRLLGMKTPGMELDRKLESLKLLGIRTEVKDVPVNEKLTQKYIIASMRYHELKTINASKKSPALEKKIKILELRYPLLSNHHFEMHKEVVCSDLNVTCRPQMESNSEEDALDEYLIKDGPLHLDGSNPRSFTAKVAIALGDNKNQKLNESMIKELEASLTTQMTPVLELKSLEDCDLLNLHTTVSLQVINTSTNPDRMFGKYCSCQTSKTIINPTLVTGLEMASLGGLGLCLTPTGVGQVFGCPTAAIAGLGASAANGINLIDKINTFSTIEDQKNIVKFLDRTNLNKAEEEFLHKKELKSLKDAGTSGLVSLIGFGIGNIGMKGLVKYFHKGNVSDSVKKLNEGESAILDSAIEELDLQTQTKAFVLLEKLDPESRETLLKQPLLLVKELKKNGKACDL